MSQSEQTVFEKEYSRLNDKQKLAVDTIDGPVMVIAGPGSGKTQVLTLRIANILKKTQIFPSNILCLTFTESGAYEMKDRLMKMIGKTSYDVNIFTFHSFCSHVIKSFPEYFSAISEFEVISDVERLKLTIKILNNNDFKDIKTYKNPYFYAKELIKKIAELKREGIDAKGYQKLIDRVNSSWDKKKENIVKGVTKTDLINEQRRIDKLNELVKFYEFYEKELNSIKKYDFDDMINNVIETLNKEEDLSITLQEKYQYILVDEYQDTNNGQNKIIEILTSYWEEQGENPNIFVVGDDDQSIFRFQGASLENILFFRKNFPKTNVIVLDKNYRSNKEIVELARRLIDTNTFQLSDVDKTIVKRFEATQKNTVSLKEDKAIKLYEFEEGEIEAFFVSSKIKELLKKGVKSSDIAVIYRENRDVYQFMEVFEAEKIPFTVDSGENILKDELIVKILKLLELINNPNDDIKFFTVASYDFIGINEIDLLRLSYFADYYDKKNKLKKTLFDIITTENLFKETKIDNPEKLTWFTNKLVEWAKLAQNKKLSDFFSKLIRDAGILNLILKDNKNKESSINIKNLNVINTFFDEIKKAERLSEDYSLSNFLSDINLLKSFDISIKEKESQFNNDGVRLMTAHRSKGLEFGYVFITELIEKKWSNKSERSLIKFPNNFVKMDLEDSKEVSFELSKQDKEEANKMKIEDERRLLYVAMTRAKHQIYLTYSKKYINNSSEKSSQASQFVSEISDKLLIEDTSNMKLDLIKLADLELISKDIDNEKESIDENTFINTIIQKFKMNATALNNYIKCGYKFKLNNILRLPRTRSLIIGNLVHRALELFFIEFKRTNKLPSKEALIEYFLKACDEELLSKIDYEETKKEGKKLLEKYYDQYKGEFKKPLECEYNFNYKNVYFENIPLSGKIDKIVLLKEADNHTEKSVVKIVDYKSGTPKSDKQIEGETKDSEGDYKRQLLFYKLLSDNDRNFEYDVKEAELDFLKEDKGKFKKYTFDYTDPKRKEELNELKKLVKDTWKNINNHKFERTTNHKNCETCEYRDHCYPNGIPVDNKTEE